MTWRCCDLLVVCEGQGDRGDGGSAWSVRRQGIALKQDLSRMVWAAFQVSWGDDESLFFLA